MTKSPPTVSSLAGAVLAILASLGVSAAQPDSELAQDNLRARFGVDVDAVQDRRAPFVRALRARARADLLAHRPAVPATDKAQQFLREHGALFGLTHADEELRQLSDHTDRFGLRTQTFQQEYQGVPVFGARLRANLDRDGRLRTVNGGVLPGISVSTTPVISGRRADAIARDHVGNVLANGARLRVTGHSLTIMQPGKGRGVGGPIYLVFEVEVTGQGGTAAAWIREFVYVDAHSGKVVEQITGVHDALDRRIYDGGFTDSFLVWSEGDTSPVGVTAIDNLIDYTEDTYNLFATLSDGNWLGWSGDSPIMQAVNNSPAVPCPNARWNGAFIEFCPGTTSDDVVTHEWTHAYTQATHGLIYQWQSGALNESYSDIFGEVVDFLNSAGTDAPAAARNVGSCSVFGGGPQPRQLSYRWLTGEDATAFGGAIRDMWHPTCLGDPGKVSDSQYHCSTQDSGGVHSNSGIPNHGFSLLVDGGTYNGVPVAAIGLTRAAHIYWRAMTAYQVPDSDFAEHADALEAACSDLAELGLNLPALSTDTETPSLSGEIVSSVHCDQVAAMAAAVELRTPPTQCNFQPLFDQDPPPLCSAGQSPVAWLANDFENGLGGWTAGTRDVANPATFDTPNWAVTGNLPLGRVGSAAFVPDLVIGNCADDTEAGVLWLQSPQVVVPAGAGSSELVFEHSIATEFLWDGGNVKIAVNGGPFVVIPDQAFTFNGYNAELNNSDNPMASEAAFTGADGGSLATLWGQSRIDLATLAQPGDTISIRFELGIDGCNGVTGWYVDDVQAYSCAVAAPDTDDDGVSDDQDNCTLVANADQRDTNGDGIGNLCDADLTGDCTVNFLDLGQMKSVFFSANPDADLDGDGAVNFVDLGYMKNSFFGTPGPSANACN